MVASVANADVYQEAHADRLRFPNNYNWLYYFTTDTIAEADRERVANVLAFVVPSLSSSTQLDLQLPIEVRPGLYRSHSKALGWESELPKLLKAHYPYSSAEGVLPLVIRADWFIQFVTDQTRSGDAYFRLLFGKPIGTLDEFLAAVGAKESTQFTFGHIEADSRVAVNRVRLVTTVPTIRRTDAWVTYDYEQINIKTDPLEHLTRGIRDGQHDHDASEAIAGLPKSLPGVEGATGALQVYGLFNAQGKVQTSAPADIVVDHTGTRGVEIRNPLSCVACHVEGLRNPSVNALRQYIESGAEAYVNDYDQREEVDRFHLTQIQKWIERSNEDYEAAVKACNGYTAAENARAFSLVIQAYDAPLRLEDCARELYVSPEELTNALGYWTAAKKPMPARLALIAHGGTINRDHWESVYRVALQILATWHASQEQAKGGHSWFLLFYWPRRSRHRRRAFVSKCTPHRSSNTRCRSNTSTCTMGLASKYSSALL